MELTILHGTEKHQVEVDQNATVQDLMNIVSDRTQIPSFNQKLIYKGTAISRDSGKPLKEFGIKAKSKIMVIGQRHDPEEEKLLEQLDQTNKQIEKVLESLLELSTDMDGVKNGFIEPSLVPKSLEKLKKNLLRCTENGMKAIESLDGMIIEEKYKDARNKRKLLVNKVQSFLDNCDKKADEIAGLTDEKT